MNKQFVLTFCSLTIYIIGLFFFLLSMAFWNKDLLLISLTQIMAGTVSYSLIEYPQNLPTYLKTKKTLFKRKW